MAFFVVCPLEIGIGLLHLPVSARIAELARARWTNFAQHPAQLFLLAVLVVPMIEEIFYRGLILPLLRRYCPLWCAMLVSSAMFGATHLGQGYANALFAFLLGMFFAWLVVRTRSLFTSVLCHATINFSWLFVFVPIAGLWKKFLATDPRHPAVALNSVLELFPAWWLILSLGLAIAGWFLRDRFVPRHPAAA